MAYFLGIFMTIQQLAGSFWTKIHKDPVYTSLIAAHEEVSKQATLDLELLKACAGRDTTPIYRRILLQPLEIKRSSNEWLVPKEIVEVSIITDRITNPTIVWLNNMDFVIDNGAINFRIDPFSVLDEEGDSITLWMQQVDIDEGYLNDIWGTPIGISAPSSKEYREILCLLYDAMLGGTSRGHVERIVAILNGGVLAKEDELVEDIGLDYNGLFIITDKNIYRSSVNGLSIVGVGLQLKSGDPLFTTCCFYNSIDCYNEMELPHVTLPKNFMDSSITDDLTFYNTTIPLNIINDNVKFHVEGKEEAVKQFWHLVHERCGKELKELLKDQTTINPCQFLLTHVLGQNILICVLRNPVTPTNLTEIDQTRLLRMIVPPHEALLIVK